MKKILIGTGNSAKVDTYRKLLKDFELEVVSAKDLDIPAPEEKGSSFEEEAINKAKYYAHKSGIPSLVDDGGMEIDALNGEPGIKSHRWLGHEMKDEEIIAEVMKRMKDVPKEKRGCKFTVALGLATPFGVFTSHADIVGVVPEKPSDKIVPGYPYDPVIFLPNYGKSVSELPDADYELMNIRTHAFEKLKDIIKELEK
jgi:XTP/dITP diphosphohydrolase